MMDYAGLQVPVLQSEKKERKEKCPDLASGHHRIMEPRKWGTRDDGFKQGQFRGVLLDTQTLVVQLRGGAMPLANCWSCGRWYGNQEEEARARRENSALLVLCRIRPANLLPPLTARHVWALGEGRGLQNPADSDHSQQGARCGPWDLRRVTRQWLEWAVAPWA